MWPRSPSVRDLSLAASFKRFDQRRDDLVHIADNAEVANREDRRFGIFVNGDDVFGTFHPDHVLRCPGDSGRDVHRRLYDLAGLTNLVRVRDPTSVNDGPLCTWRSTEKLGEVFDEFVFLRFAQTAATRNDNRRVFELWSLAFFDMTLSDTSCSRCSSIGD